jgi:hypothetical protein
MMGCGVGDDDDADNGVFVLGHGRPRPNQLHLKTDAVCARHCQKSVCLQNRRLRRNVSGVT